MPWRRLDSEDSSGEGICCSLPKRDARRGVEDVKAILQKQQRMAQLLSMADRYKLGMLTLHSPLPADSILEEDPIGTLRFYCSNSRGPSGM
eukprot:scaffold7243_cov394-Prasinococcus_capsulatus_cf.AAC.14